MNNDHAQAIKQGLDPKWLILGAVMLGSLMGPLDASIVNTVLPKITESFHTDVSISQWVPTVYLLTISCLILLYGRLGDMLGYKRIFTCGLAAFTITSILCGFSQSIWMLIAFRALQGLAAGMMMSVSFAIITSTFPPGERGRAMGIYAISIAIGLGIGPTLGGTIAEYLNWRYVFFVNVPVGFCALLLGSRVIPKGSVKPGQRLDVTGAVAAFVFLTSFLLFANRGGNWGWLSAASVTMIVIAAISAVAFVLIERRAIQPMLNLELFHSRVFSFASLSALINFMALYALVFITPFYLAFVLKYSILKVGLVMVASPVATLIVAPLSGMLSDRIGSRSLAVGGMIVCSIGMFLLGGLDANSNSFDVAWRLAVCGIGSGMFQSPNNSAVMGSVPPMRLGIASGMLAAMRNVGMVLGIAIAGAVLYNLAPVAASGHIGQLTDSEVREFVNGLHWAYVSGSAMAGIAAITSLFAVRRRTEA